MAVWAFGYVLNALVMACNHGQMPVLAPGWNCSLLNLEDDPLHSCMNAHTHLKFLADWIVMAEGGEIKGIASPGDFFEWFGELTFYPALVTWIMYIIKDSSGRNSDTIS